MMDWASRAAGGVVVVVADVVAQARPKTGRKRKNHEQIEGFAWEEQFTDAKDTEFWRS